MAPAEFLISITPLSLLLLTVRTILLPVGVSLSRTLSVSPGGMLARAAANLILLDACAARSSARRRGARTNRVMRFLHEAPRAGARLQVMGTRHPEFLQVICVEASSASNGGGLHLSRRCAGRKGWPGWPYRVGFLAL